MIDVALISSVPCSKFKIQLQNFFDRVMLVKYKKVRAAWNRVKIILKNHFKKIKFCCKMHFTINENTHLQQY